MNDFLQQPHLASPELSFPSQFEFENHQTNVLETHPSSLDRSDMVECRSALVAVSLGDRRYGKRMALIRFCLPEIRKEKENL